MESKSQIILQKSTLPFYIGLVGSTLFLLFSIGLGAFLLIDVFCILLILVFVYSIISKVCLEINGGDFVIVKSRKKILQIPINQIAKFDVQTITSATILGAPLGYTYLVVFLKEPKNFIIPEKQALVVGGEKMGDYSNSRGDLYINLAFFSQSPNIESSLRSKLNQAGLTVEKVAELQSK